MFDTQERKEHALLSRASSMIGSRSNNDYTYLAMCILIK